MERRHAIIKLVLVIFILFVSINWYGRLGYSYEQRINNETILTYEESKKIILDPIEQDKEYFYRQAMVIKHSRTWVPSVWKQDTLFKDKKRYFSRDR